MCHWSLDSDVTVGMPLAFLIPTTSRVPSVLFFSVGNGYLSVIWWTGLRQPASRGAVVLLSCMRNARSQKSLARRQNSGIRTGVLLCSRGQACLFPVGVSWVCIGTARNARNQRPSPRRHWCGVRTQDFAPRARLSEQLKLSLRLHDNSFLQHGSHGRHSLPALRCVTAVM